MAPAAQMLRWALLHSAFRIPDPGLPDAAVPPGPAAPGVLRRLRGLHGLQLRLQVRDRFIQLGDTRLQLVDRIVQRLHLSGDAVHFAAHRIVLRADLLLQGGHRRAHLIRLVGSLLRQVLQHSQTRIHCRLQPLHRIQQLLHLGLQFDHFL